MATRVGDERKTATLLGIPLGFYYYLIPHNKVSVSTYLGYVDTIQSLTYNPFIEEEDVTDLVECTFNSDKYGIPEGGIPKCYRIQSFNKIEKTLGEIDLFESKPDSYSIYDLDPKLQTFPFKYYLITDYINSPILVKPQMIMNYNKNKLTVKVKTATISNESKFNLFVDGYKGDYKGNLEGMNNSTALMLPVTSSIYSQFISTSMASFSQGNINAMLENDKTLSQGLASNSLSNMKNQTSNLINGIGGVLSLLMGNVGGGIGQIGSSVTNGIFQQLQNNLTESQLKENHQLTEYEINSMTQAKVTDMLNTPNSIKTSGNDTLFNLINSDKKIDIIEYTPKARILYKLNTYFKRYGYRMNDYGKLSDYINNRKYFNYIKTNICNVASSTVPLECLEEFKAILNNGTTIWHIDNGAEVGNYEVNNEEV